MAFSRGGRRLWLQAEDKGVVPVFAMDASGGPLTRVVAHGTNTEIESANGQTECFKADEKVVQIMRVLTKKHRSSC